MLNSFTKYVEKLSNPSGSDKTTGRVSSDLMMTLGGEADGGGGGAEGVCIKVDHVGRTHIIKWVIDLMTNNSAILQLVSLTDRNN